MIASNERLRGSRVRQPGRPAIPSADTTLLGAAARRTRAALVLLALVAIAIAIAFALAARRAPDVPAALRGGDGLMVVVDVSSSTLGFSNMIARSLLALANDPSQRAGLVLASQSAYVALPPETPGAALHGWQRMISYINVQNHKLAVRAKLDRTPLPNPTPGDYPWVGVFTGGTRLSAGLAAAIRALRDAGVRRGQIVLISDLRDAPEDLPRVSALIARMHELGIQLRVVTVGNAARDQKAFSDLGGAQFVIAAADAAYAPDRERALPSRPSALPLVVLGCVLALVLAFAELLLPLRWGRRREVAA
jgi:hypothetical protein